MTMAVYVNDFGMPARVGAVQRSLAALGRLFPRGAARLRPAARVAARLVPGPRGHRQTTGATGGWAAENWHYDVTESKRRQAISRGARSPMRSSSSWTDAATGSRATRVTRITPDLSSKRRRQNGLTWVNLLSP